MFAEKSTFYTIAIALLSFLAHKSRAVDEKHVLFWNVLEGAGNGKMTHIKSYIESKQFHIVGFSELNGWNRKSFHKYFEESYPHSVFLKTKTGYHLGAISQYPITLLEKTAQNPMHHGYIFFESMGIKFVLTHLNPHSSENRLREVQHILNVTDPYRSEENDEASHLCFIGDFNTLSSTDTYSNRQLKKIFEDARTKKKFFAHTENGYEVDYRPYKLLIKSGMVDTGLANDWTVPTPANYDIMHATRLRLDMIFCRQAYHGPQLKNSIVHKESLVEKLSDHFPVSISLSGRNRDGEKYFDPNGMKNIEL